MPGLLVSMLVLHVGRHESPGRRKGVRRLGKSANDANDGQLKRVNDKRNRK